MNCNWMRWNELQAAVGFVSCAARHLNAVDVQCRLGAILDPYLRYHVGQMNREALLLEALQPPVSRVIWDNVINCNEILLLLSTLSERQESTRKSKDWIPHPAEISGPIKTVSILLLSIIHSLFLLLFQLLELLLTIYYYYYYYY